jgi:hypothetical protein
MSEVFPWSPGVAGLIKADVSLLLTLNGVEVSAAAVTLVEIGSDGDYEFRNLPDATGSDIYWLRVEYLGQRQVYRWPVETRQPQAVVFRQVFKPLPAVLQLGTGDTALPVQLEIEGLAADPTGSTVTFSMRKQSGGAAVIDEADAGNPISVDTVTDPVTSEVTYTATVSYAWTTEDTATAGHYHGWFTLVYPGGGIMTAPPDKRIEIRIYA